MNSESMNNIPDAFQIEAKTLQKVAWLGREIAALEIELKSNQPLLNQLQMLKTNMQSCQEYLISKDHYIAFYRLDRCRQDHCDLWHSQACGREGGTALSTSSGRTTLCEVEIRRGEKTRILISPCSSEETRSYLRDFVDVLQMRHEERPNDDREVVSMSSEVERCIRNMIGLPVRTTKAPDGSIKRTDEALDLYKKLGDPAAFMEEAFKRLKLDERVTTELVCDKADETGWIKDQFGQINHGKHPLTPMPQRIVIEQAKAVVSEPALNISLIDTKGLDGNVERRHRPAIPRQSNRLRGLLKIQRCPRAVRSRPAETLDRQWARPADHATDSIAGFGPQRGGGEHVSQKTDLSLQPRKGTWCDWARYKIRSEPA
ncbi:MAG: hypothetical protein IPM55_23325 [Acidobacteria bacterium]|nr:hypothetical protein [Acidobacteriota bacterium]